MQSAAKRFSKPILLMVGAPGTGKSTIGQRLSADLGLPLFSTGTYLRTLISSDRRTPLIRAIRECMLKGNLIDSSVIMKVIAERLREEDERPTRAIIFDGCPRIKVEVEDLLKIGNIKFALHLFAREDVLLEKLAGRRECEKCRKTFNIARIHRDGYDYEPLLPHGVDINVCDCGGRLVRREDDTDASIAQRMREYQAKTYPLINQFYEKLGILKKFTLYRGINDYPEIKSIVQDSLNV